MPLPHTVHAVLRHWASGLVLCSAATVLPAQAGLIVQNASFGTGGQFSNVDLAPVGSQEFGVQLTGGRSSGGLMSFNRFDPTLGTLTAVFWELVDANYSFSVGHRAEVFGQIGTINEFSMKAHASGVGNLGGQSLLGLTNQSFNLSAGAENDCSLHSDLGLPEFPGCGLNTSGSDSVAIDALAADVTAFIGTGSFDEEADARVDWSDRIDLVGHGTPPFFGPGPADVSGRFDFSGQLRLVYEYTAAHGVPEPGTLWLVAGLLPMLGLARRAERPFPCA